MRPLCANVWHACPPLNPFPAQICNPSGLPAGAVARRPSPVAVSVPVPKTPCCIVQPRVLIASARGSVSVPRGRGARARGWGGVPRGQVPRTRARVVRAWGWLGGAPGKGAGAGGKRAAGGGEGHFP